jgi:hypothetical protein
MIGLSCLSWLSFNIKRKTEEGHFRNPGHGELYDDLLKILQEISDSIRINTPQNAT